MSIGRLSQTSGAATLVSADVTSTTGSPTITTSGIYTIYQFTGSGTIVLGKAGLCDSLVIGGGGGGGSDNGAGGGAGGYLDATAAGTYLPAGTNTVTVGAGGAGVPNKSGVQGASSRLGFYYGVGGGGAGGQGAGNTAVGFTGGSGGGGSGSAIAGGTGLTGQGNDGAGGGGSAIYGGGGGGAGGVGATGNVSGAGGAGLASSITGTSVTRAVGGSSDRVNGNTPVPGAANSGTGGGGTDGGAPGGGAGGSGIVIVRVVT